MNKRLCFGITVLAIILFCVASFLACSQDACQPPLATPDGISRPAEPDNPTDNVPDQPNAPIDGDTTDKPPTVPDEPIVTPPTDDPDPDPDPPIDNDDDPDPDPPDDPPTEEHIHNVEFIDEIAASCTEDGCRAYFFCSGCNSYFADTDCSIPVEEIVIPALGHDYTETIVVPSCTAEGYTLHTCNNCNDKYTDSGAEALGHDWNVYETIEPTCTADGQTVLLCSVCDATDIRSIPALGHDYTETIVTPSCTAGGYTLHTCNNCNDEYTDSEAEALGHDWGEWEAVITPSCTTAGEKQRVCLRDNSHVDSGVIPAVSHTFSDKFSHNGAEHWHTSLCGCDVVSDKSAHKFADGECICGLDLFDFTLTDNREGYIVTGLNADGITEIVIPSEYNNLPVLEIGAEAFKGKRSLEKVTVPKSIVLIGKNAFKDSGLKQAVFEATNNWFQANSATGPTSLSITLTNNATANAKELTVTRAACFWIRKP